MSGGGEQLMWRHGRVIFPELVKGQHRDSCTVGEEALAERRARDWGNFPFLELF